MSKQYTEQDLVREILVRIPETYKWTVAQLGSRLSEEGPPESLHPFKVLGEPVRIVMPLPRWFLAEAGTTIERLAGLVQEHSLVTTARRYGEKVIRDDKTGEIVTDFFKQDLEPLEILCKPFGEVELS